MQEGGSRVKLNLTIAICSSLFSISSGMEMEILPLKDKFNDGAPPGPTIIRLGGHHGQEDFCLSSADVPFAALHTAEGCWSSNDCTHVQND